ncbi:hypothetical protein I6N90_05195 [Paenibacillus sp. GSMTC-2017]|uniref:hypothetical protein n=1 Tax=Paenibacillus sp. GSMTC-2017 TaxID=2794350 RepID=UPI001A289DDA|nr:hypothetical protein [Paenibacillus sp. GSMTC-2017]MBH5317204.1 hypothetical protein [Paenibacillus sp. GSMTC-2017]
MAEFEPRTQSNGIREQKVLSAGITNNGIVGISQTVRVEPSKPFSINARIDVESLVNAKIQLYVDFYRDNNHITGINVTDNTAISGGTITLSNYGIIPAETTFAKVYILVRATNNGGAGTFYADSIEFSYSSNTQLIDNSGFDAYTGTNGIANEWAPENIGTKTASYAIDKSITGTRVQKVVGSEMSNNGLLGVSQVVKVEPNKPFTINSRLNIEGLTNAKVQLYVDFFRGANYITGSHVTEQTISLGRPFTLSNQGVIPAETTHAKVYALVRATSDGGAGTLYVDSLEFSYGSESQLFVNPSFDSYTGTMGVADGWGPDNSGAKVATFEVQASSTGKKVQKVAGSQIPNNGAVGVSQIIKVEPNKPFTVSGRIHVEGLSNAKIQMFVEFFRDINNRTGHNVTEQLHTSGANITLSNEGVVPAGTAFAKVYVLVRATSDGGSGTFTVDAMNFSYDENRSLLVNPNFYTYTGTNGAADSWDQVNIGGTSSLFEVQPTSIGKRAQKIVGSGISNGGVVGVSQIIKVEPNKPFKISGKTKIEKLSQAKIQFYVEFLDRTNRIIGNHVTEYATVSGGTITLSNQGVTPAGTTYAKVYVLIRATGEGGSGAFYVEEINYLYRSYSQLIVNPTFDTYSGTNGVADGWGQSNIGGTLSTYDVQTLASGKRVQKVVGSGIASNGVVGVNQVIKVEENKPYTFSGNINVESLSKAKVQLYVEFFKGDGQLVGINAAEQRATSNGNITLSEQGVTPAGAAFAKVFALIRATGDAGAGTFYIDSLNFSNGTRSNLLFDPDFENSTGSSSLAEGWDMTLNTDSGDQIKLISKQEDVTPNRTSYTYDSAGKIVTSSFYSKGNKTQIGHKFDLNGNLLKKMSLVGPIVSKPVNQGTHAQQVTAWWLKKDDYRGISQTVQVDSEKAFTLNAAVNVQSLRHAKVQLYVDFFNSSHEIVGASIVDAATTTNGEYKTLTIDGKTPAHATYARVSVILRATNNDGAGVFYVDSVNFNYVK